MNNDVLDIFVINLNDDIHSMNKQEKNNYFTYEKQINLKYKSVLEKLEEIKVNQVKELIDLIMSQNSLLNNSYYKQGIRIGFNLNSAINNNKNLN